MTTTNRKPINYVGRAQGGQWTILRKLACLLREQDATLKSVTRLHTDANHSPFTKDGSSEDRLRDGQEGLLLEANLPKQLKARNYATWRDATEVSHPAPPERHRAVLLGDRIAVCVGVPENYYFPLQLLNPLPATR